MSSNHNADEISSRAFFLYGLGGQEVVVRTPDNIVLKPLDDEGLIDHGREPMRLSFMDVQEPGNQDSRLQAGKAALLAVDRLGGCHFIAYDA